MWLYRRYIKKSCKLGMMEMEMELIGNLGVKIKERTSLGGIVVCVCCRPPDQEEQQIEAFYTQQEVASCSQDQTKVPMGDQPDYLLMGPHSRT